MKAEQLRLTGQLEVVERKLGRLATKFTDLSHNLDQALIYLQGLDVTYRKASEAGKRQINQAMFER